GCFGLIYRGMRSRLSKAGRDQREAKREKHQITREAMGGIKEVKVLGLEQVYLDRFVDPSARVVRHQATVALVGEMPRFALEALAFGGMLLLTLYLLWSRDGALEEALPVIGAFAFAGFKLMPTVQQLFRSLSEMRFTQPALEGLHADLTRSDEPEPTPGEAGPPIRLREEMRLEGVGYRYSGASRDALSDFTLAVPAGAHVALVGPTGAGKTTVLDVVLGLLRPTKGRILIDGVALTPETTPRWRESLGYVPQTIFLVDDSIAGNIAFGALAEEIDREAVRAAAAAAQLDDFVGTLPDGYDTVIGEGGVRLSGGQRQRIGIARTLYRDPSFIVLDEATSALDTATERRVFEAIRALAGRKTILTVTHRLSTVVNCDRIFVMQDGRIAGDGPYEDLQRESRAFRDLVEAAEAE
ncbi:MAG: ABC transporter ATP-binding protein, partial [Pseudomonadota bacterium]